MSPVSAGIMVLRSVAVQYLVTCDNAPMPNGSISADSVSSAGSRNSTRDMKNSARNATAPTYVHIIDRVAVASAKKPAPMTSSDGSA